MPVTPRSSDSSCLRTKWAHFTARTSPATLGTPRSSVLEHRQRRRGLLAPWCSVIASDAGDSSLLGARTSPATPGTPLLLRSCYVSSVCYQAAPRCSDQGADLGQHVWGLDTCMLDDVRKLSDFFFFDPAIRFILHLPAGSGTKWAHFTLR